MGAQAENLRQASEPAAASFRPSEPLRMPKALLLLAKPGIVVAEMLAAASGALLATPAPSTAHLGLLLLLIVLSASGAAMGNCLLEEERDRKMARLDLRNSALRLAGRRRVLPLATALILIPLLLAALCFNFLTMLLLLGATVVYLWIYTGWLKRITPWSVLAGAIPGAIPPLVGAAAVSGSLPLPVLILAGIIYIWQLPHFWFLALHCSGQYRLAGIPALPVSHGEIRTAGYTVIASIALVPASLLLASIAGYGAAKTMLLAALSIAFVFAAHICAGNRKLYRHGFVISLAYMALLLLAVIDAAIP